MAVSRELVRGDEHKLKFASAHVFPSVPKRSSHVNGEDIGRPVTRPSMRSSGSSLYAMPAVLAVGEVVALDMKLPLLRSHLPQAMPFTNLLLFLHQLSCQRAQRSFLPLVTSPSQERVHHVVDKVRDPFSFGRGCCLQSFHLPNVQVGANTPPLGHDLVHVIVLRELLPH